MASLVCLLTGHAWSQQVGKPLPAFDAASVRPFADRCGAWGKPDIDPTHLRMKCAPLRFIILNAYGLDDFQLTGLPDWASSEFFTINAVTDAPTPP
ncbi:MAG TPA: DUF3738 domain-containing protein, partial [Acidobacteriaceae bacterium]|nr:DUF3738 domain-containing protein [Acidobacteriaceae bacterium]